MQTVTVMATRSSALSLSEMEMLVGSAIVIGALVWMVLARMRRDRHEPQV
jgi:hypothetical protein